VNHATQIGLDEDPFEIARGEEVEQRLDALRRRRPGVEKQHVLPMEPARAAANVVADFSNESFLANGDPRLLGKLFQPLEEQLRGGIFSVALGFALLHRLEISSDADRDCKGSSRDSRRVQCEKASAFRAAATVTVTPVRIAVRLAVRLMLPPLAFFVFFVFFMLAVTAVALLVCTLGAMPMLVLFVLTAVGALLGIGLLAQARDRLFQRFEAVSDALELSANRGVRAKFVE